MARPKKEPTNTKLHNVQDRRDAITNAFDQIYKTERDIDSAREQHIKPLTDGKKKLWRTLKGDTGIERTDLELHYKIYARARLADELGGDDGQRMQDNLREVFFALQKGGQLNFLDAMQDAA